MLYFLIGFNLIVSIVIYFLVIDISKKLETIEREIDRR